MSRKQPKGPEDPFASIPPQESFDAFPSLSAFPDQEIAFLTGKSASEEDFIEPKTKPDSEPHTQPDRPSVKKTKKLSVTQTAALSDNSAFNQPDSGTGNEDDRQADSHTQSLKAPQSADLSNARTGGHTVSLAAQAPLQPLGRPAVADRLNANQRRVLDLLLDANPYIVKFRDIADALRMREATVRTILRRLSVLSFLTFKKARDGNIQGVTITFNQELLEQYRQGRELRQETRRGGATPLDGRHAKRATQGLSRQRLKNHTDGRTAGQKADQQACLQAPLAADLAEWDDDFLQLMWPRVHEAGVRLTHLRQALEARSRLGKVVDREHLVVSLDRADWELETTGRIADLATGEPVGDVGAYILAALARWGVFRAHPDYVSREEHAAADAAGELARRREAASRPDVVASGNPVTASGTM